MDIPFLSPRKPVIDLRREPLETDQGGCPDDLRESQLLRNELFLPLGEENGWYYGEAVEQPYHSGKGWRGYPGWVRSGDMVPVAAAARPNAVVVAPYAGLFAHPESIGRGPLAVLPLGSRVRVLPDSGTNGSCFRVRLYSDETGWVERKSLLFYGDATNVSAERAAGDLVRNASLLLGTPYLWGGRSVRQPPGCPQCAVGVDCSALVGLCYRLSGIDVPRNARDQWLVADAVEEGIARPGDLLFVAREETPNIVTHVMMCAGAETLIEACDTGRTVSQRTFSEKFGLSLSELRRSGFAAGGRRIYLRRIARAFDLEALRRGTGAG